MAKEKMIEEQEPIVLKNGNGYAKTAIGYGGSSIVGGAITLAILKLLNIGDASENKDIINKRFEDIDTSLKRIEEKVECIPILKYRIENMETEIKELKHVRDFASNPYMSKKLEKEGEK